MSSLKSLLLLTTVGCFYAKSGDVAACLHIDELLPDVGSTAVDWDLVHIVALGLRCLYSIPVIFVSFL